MVKNAIKVYARLKPERSRKKVTSHEVYHRPKEHADEDFLVLTAPPRICNEYIDNRPESWNFSFFKIFQETAEQEIIFDQVAKPVIHSVLDGYNGTIFAYGQTGSGKTYTITGEQNNYDLQGILPRTLHYLFDIVKKKAENLYFEISYLEIYNENGYDLLNRKQEWGVATKLEDLPRVTIQEDETGTLHLKNLSFWSVANEKDALDLLLIGDTNRVVSETPMNPMSSRSHCIFTIIVSMKKFGENHYSRAKMHLVDLAGSERVYKCAITGTILTEAKHINLNLHYLEQVIVCLGQQNANHIPYRNSLLTAILRDSLGGNCLTTMLATLSLSIKNLEETISTCRFAQRVALVKNDLNLVVQHDVHSENALLKMENERLKQQIEMLKNQFINQSPEELSAEEKMGLDKSVERFLESDENFICYNDPQKLQYCLESLKRKFNLKKQGIEDSSEYYKNLIFQRDKEISLLIDMLKKERKKLSKQKVAKNAFQEKKCENLKENGTTNAPIKEFSKGSQKDTLNSGLAQVENKSELNQITEEKNTTFDNNLMSLTPQDICQLKTLISMYNGHVLNQHQLLVGEKHSDKESEQDFVSSGKLNDSKKENVLKSVDSTGKSILEKQLNKSSPENLKKAQKPDFLGSKSNISSEKLICTKTQNLSSTIEKDGVSNYSEKSALLKETRHPEVATLNLYEIVKEDLRDDTISQTHNGKSKRHRSKHPSGREKQRSKTSSKCSLFSESSSKESMPVETKIPETTITEDSTIKNHFSVVNHNESTIQRDEGPEIMRSNNFTSMENPELLRKNLDVLSDHRRGSSVNLPSSRSMSSVNSKASENVTRLPELSRNSICINNDTSNPFNKSNVEFLNSSRRKRNDSADLMHRFQADIDTRMTWKSFDSPKQKASCPISNDSGNSATVEKSARELEKRLLSKDEDNLEEELIRMTEYLPSNSTSSLRIEENKKREVLDFDKSLPLTGDPDIDEEIIAFYKAKRTGGTY